ncbi:MAG: NAD(P)/FAD-dependent oxidoreductase [Rhodothermia bacterium]|nr:NAD(P)/FAD-dependent oxidoreductase [Rhodothermia bacterium]
MSENYQVVIVGGGTAGITVAARLRELENPPRIALIEPSEKHYYQPIWTLVGAGVFPKEISVRNEADYIPDGVDWIKDKVTSFDPEKNLVVTSDGKTIGYDALVVCPGIQLNWSAIPGLAETIGSNGVCSNYGFERSEYTWEVLRNLKGGRAIFTQPNTPVKCGGAPQKIMYLAADYLRLHGHLDDTDIQFMSPGTVVFGVPEFERTLKKVIARYGITFNTRHELVEVRGEQKKAIIRVRNEQDEIIDDKEYPFDMMHVVPPQSAPEFIKESPLANAEGWVDVNQETLQHNRFPNVFSLGDASSTPNAKTGAAVRKQAPVVVDHLMQVLQQGEIKDRQVYKGYSSCPLVTGFGRLILAEFDYDNRPMPSFPFDTTRERYSMYALKLYVLPQLYWNGMLRGRA